MDFSINEETMMLKNNAARFLKEKVTGALIKELLKTDTGYSESLWKEMANLGWLGMTYDEQYGGSGMNFFDICVLFEEIGKSGFPSPFFSSAILSGMVINEAGDADLKKSRLPEIIQGRKIATTALIDEKGQYDYTMPSIRAKLRGSSCILNGTRLLVPYANAANEILLCANVAGTKAKGPTLFIIESNAAGLKIAPLDTMRWEKTFAVVFEDVEVPKKT